jgi:hypothetical protein
MINGAAAREPGEDAVIEHVLVDAIAWDELRSVSASSATEFSLSRSVRRATSARGDGHD